MHEHTVNATKLILSQLRHLVQFEY